MGGASSTDAFPQDRVAGKHCRFPRLCPRPRPDDDGFGDRLGGGRLCLDHCGAPGSAGRSKRRRIRTVTDSSANAVRGAVSRCGTGSMVWRDFRDFALLSDLVGGR